MTAYQKYQLQWMIDHNVSLDDLYRSIRDNIQYSVSSGDATVEEATNNIATFIEETGFEGMLWACEAEWAECEAHEQLSGSIVRAETPLGAIIVRAATDPAHPGVWVDLRRPDADCDAPLALVEFSGDEGDHEEPSIITRVWGDVCEEDYSKRIIHQNIEKYFSTEEVGGNLYGND